MSKLRLLLLIALPWPAFSQNLPAPGPSNTICLTLPVAAKVRDSLRVLPLVRKEARQSRIAAGRYKTAADTSFAAYLKQVQANGNTRLALREQKVETARYEVAAKKWKGKAQRRGFWNWLAAAAVGGLTLGFATR
jgi:hypothetical protein